MTVHMFCRESRTCSLESLRHWLTCWSAMRDASRRFVPSVKVFAKAIHGPSRSNVAGFPAEPPRRASSSTRSTCLRSHELVSGFPRNYFSEFAVVCV